MQPIKKQKATITKIVDLSPTAREYTLALSEPMPFSAGAFVNLFLDCDGEMVRRAYSISSSDKNNKEITLSIRLSLDGKMTPFMWREDLLGREVDIMGPLGLNTASKMQAKKVYLFGFGVGAGVVKSLAAHMLDRDDVEKLVVMTGSRNIGDILHKDYFDEVQKDGRVTVTYVVSDKDNAGDCPSGYIQDHLDGLDFNDSDVYVCGQKVACDGLLEKVKSTNPENCNFFVEDFH